MGEKRKEAQEKTIRKESSSNATQGGSGRPCRKKRKYPKSGPGPATCDRFEGDTTSGNDVKKNASPPYYS